MAEDRQHIEKLFRNKNIVSVIYRCTLWEYLVYLYYDEHNSYPYISPEKIIYDKLKSDDNEYISMLPADFLLKHVKNDIIVYNCVSLDYKFNRWNKGRKLTANMYGDTNDTEISSYLNGDGVLQIGSLFSYHNYIEEYNNIFCDISFITLADSDTLLAYVCHSKYQSPTYRNLKGSPTKYFLCIPDVRWCQVKTKVIERDSNNHGSILLDTLSCSDDILKAEPYRYKSKYKKQRVLADLTYVRTADDIITGREFVNLYNKSLRNDAKRHFIFEDDKTIAL